MQILHLEASPGWGGQEIRIFREMIGMRELGHNLVLGVMRGGELGKRARKAGFTVYEIDFNRSRWLVSFWKLIKIVQEHKIDVINTHSSLDAWLGGLVGRWTGRKIIRTRHLSTPIKSGWNSRMLYGTLADFVVTTCASIVPIISRQSGKPIQKCRSVPTGIDPESIQVTQLEADMLRKKYGIAKETFLVGTACFMRSWKGIQDLLKAADLLRNHKDLQWIIIGGGHAETYHRMASELELKEKVIFTGHLDNPFPALLALDVFALLSTAHEGVSQAILQAAFLGKPLIATSTGGLGEVCIDGITGCQVEPFSPEQVAKSTLRLKEDLSYRTRLGVEAKSLVGTHFSWQSTIRQMEEIFHA